jgi:hypothetical protein
MQNTFALIVKKVFVIVLMLLYGLTSSGMSLQVHFCCGEIQNIDLAPQKGCGMDHEMGTMSCCETKVLGAKDLGDYEPVHLLAQGIQLPVLFFSAYVNNPAPLVQPRQIAPHSSAPPLLHADLYQWICTYRI